MSLPYYPMYPRDFFEGTQRMSLELKGAYIMLLNLIYTRNGPVDDEDGYLARYVGCSIRKWQKLRLELVGLGKIKVVDGLIHNSRADEELSKRTSYVDQKRENRARPNKNNAVESQPRTTREKQEPEPILSVAIAPESSSTPRKARKPSTEHFMADDWWPSESDFEWALRPENTKGIQLTIEEINGETNQCKRWFLDKRDAGDTRGKRPGHSRSWQTWICKSAPEILRARPRADRGSDASRPRGAAQFAPNVGLFDALALAGAKARNGGQDAPRGADYGDGAGEPRRLAAFEVIDREDARGADARKAGGDRGSAGAVVLPLSAAGGR